MTEAFDWQHGTFLGSIMSSEKTAAAAGTIGEVRFDPFAMLPFMGYNAGDYMQHWLEMGERTPLDKQPKLFWVNWFRKSPEGKFLWPGFGDNSRVLEWVLQRVAGEGEAVDTAIGRVPTVDALDTTGLDVDPATLAALLSVDNESWRQEVPLIGAHYDTIGSHLPDALRDQLAALEKRLSQ